MGLKIFGSNDAGADADGTRTPPTVRHGKRLFAPASKRGLMMKQKAEDGITKSAIRKLARRAGIKRISGKLYDVAREVMVKDYLVNILKDAIKYTEYARRKTLTTGDILHALKRNGKTLYGFGTVEP